MTTFQKLERNRNSDLQQDSEQTSARTDHRADTVILLAIAAAVALLHILTNSRYGFHRDELQFLSDARHLDWGYVPYPPFTAFIERLSLMLFGVSILWLRLFSVLAQSAAILLTGLMARELGGRRLAQVAAAISVALSPLPLFEGTEFQYSSFDYLWWTLAAWCLLRLLRTENPRWWLGVGAALGLALETKYSVTFFIAGILGGLLLTRARRHFLSGWFWAGCALAVLIFLPNLIWLFRHDFISYHFLQSIHARDVRRGRTDGFLVDQVRICINFAATPLALAGLISLFRSNRFRPVAWIFLIPLALFFFAKGRGYYVAGAYPMLLAAGAAASERWLASLRRPWRIAVPALYFLGVAGIGAYVCAVILPFASSGPLRDFALARNGDLREELGWEIMLQSIAQVRDSLTPAQQAHLGIVVGNYGEHGAVDLLGPAYHLPPSISGTNSTWLQSYPQSQPTTLIVLGEENHDDQFTGCKLASRIPYPKDLHNEESNNHAEIYVCGPPKLPWPELWKIALSYG